MPLFEPEPLGLLAKQWQFLEDKNAERYVQASEGSGRKLVLESTRRQFLTARDILARLNGSYGEKARRGVLLADDVGLGKTTIAALVAWVVASAGDTRKVRILAPNDVMRRRWEEELKSHVRPLQECAKHLGVKSQQVKGRGIEIERLSRGSIQVVNHFAVLKKPIKCDLLIIDEAHRAKDENSAFARALKERMKQVSRVLILTATPFSIHLAELIRMLKLIRGDAARSPVRDFKKALDDLYAGNTALSREATAERLVIRAKAAIESLAPFVIRYGIDDIPNELKDFGRCDDWSVDVPSAKPEELELMMRMDRALRVVESSKATNDPRFHVGWQHLDAVKESLKSEVPQLAEPVKAVVENQLKFIKQLRGKVGIHSKMKAVADAVKTTIEQGEKVVLFCHHHATAEELTVHLDSELPKVTAPDSPNMSAWKRAWDMVLPKADCEERQEEALRDTFIKWLCAELNRAQTWNWLRAASPSSSTSEANLAEALEKTSARLACGQETIADAAKRLYSALLESRSSRTVLRNAQYDLKYLPGATRVLGVCEPVKEKESLFLHNQQPDTVISIFNSPFGPDVLVVTDKLSEGIDLHRYCRHLIHYELDPSPIRTVQRNGRVRRVNSWAAVTGQPILYAYPAFRGTRDHRLVQIMKKRLDSFSLLLGGAHEIEDEDLAGSDDAEKWRNEVIDRAKKSLATAGGQLLAREPGRSNVVL